MEESAAGVKEFPSYFSRGCVVSRPTKISDQRCVLRNGTAVEEVLVHWEDDDGQVPSWEPLHVVSRRFPSLILEDKDKLNGEGVDTCMEEVQEQPASPERTTFDTTTEVEVNEEDLGRSGRPKRRGQGSRKYDDYIVYR